MKHQHLYLLIALLLGTTIGCTSLKHVHDFAAASGKVIEVSTAALLLAIYLKP